MAVYEYTVKDRTGKRFSGVYDDVESVAVLRQEMTKMGYVVVKARRKKDFTRGRKRIKQWELVAFAYKFAGMYSAGLPLARCLETLERQTESHGFRYVIADIRQSVEAGSTLAEAFGKHPNVFSEFFLGMLEAGEAGGKLGTALQMSATYLEKRRDLKRKTKSAFAYPIVVSVTCLAVVVFLLVQVIPVFSRLYKQMHVSLPGPTRALLGLSSLLREWWWAIVMAGIAGAIVLPWLLKNPRIRARWDAFKLNMPLFAKLNRMIVVSHFTRTLAMLISVGVSVIEALDTASVVAHNHKVKEIAKRLQEAIRAGNPVASSLEKHDIFPPIITQLASSGEEAGVLPDMLNKGADFLDKDIDRTISTLLVILEPALTVMVGAIVGFVLIGAYMPMFDYIDQLMKQP